MGWVFNTLRPPGSLQHLHILNLSIGGPDYLDLPFTDKIREVTANGIIMSACVSVAEHCVLVSPTCPANQPLRCLAQPLAYVLSATRLPVAPYLSPTHPAHPMTNTSPCSLRT